MCWKELKQRSWSWRWRPRVSCANSWGKAKTNVMPKQYMAVQRSMQGTKPVLKMLLRRRLMEYRRCSSHSCSAQARAPGQGVLQGPACVPHCLEVMLHLHLPAKGWAAPLPESLKAGHKGILHYSHPLPESFVSQGDLELLWAAVCYRKINFRKILFLLEAPMIL